MDERFDMLIAMSTGFVIAQHALLVPAACLEVINYVYHTTEPKQNYTSCQS
jgi:hypothetical protein